MKAAIIGSGNISDYVRIGGLARDCDIIICCDGGADHARQMRIMPSAIVGDLDSVSDDTIEFFSRAGVEIKKYEPEKDFSDMEIGLGHAVRLGADEILLLGATGYRLDHSLANIGLLCDCLRQGISAELVDDDNRITLINKKTILTGEPGQTVSLLPFTEQVTGISTSGLKYPLKNESLRWGAPRGISNMLTSEKAVVDLRSGILMIIVPVRL